MSNPSIKRNFIYNMLYQILAIIVPLITSPYLARTLGAESIGINSWTHSITFYFAIFAILGINNYGNRTIAIAKSDKDKLSTTFCSIYACQISISTLIIILYIMYLLMWANEYKLIATLQIFHILANAIDITWFFYGLEEFKVTVMRNSFVKFFSLVSIFTFVKDENDLWKYTLIVAGSTFLGQLIVWPMALKRIKVKRPQAAEMIPHIKPILILFIPVLAISIFTNMDKYMIGKMSNIVESGYYENTDKIIGIPKAVITALGTVMLPRTASLISQGKQEKSKYYIELAMTYTMLISSAFVFGMASVADVFSIVFWGEDFLKCGKLIACMSPAIAFSVFGNVIRTQYLIPRAKDKEYTVSLIVGAIVNLTVNFVLIPRMGALGAVIGTVIAEFIMTFLQAVYVRHELPIATYIKSGIPFWFSGFVMYLIVKMVRVNISTKMIDLLLLICVGAIAYSAMIMIYMRWSKNEIVISIRKELQEILKKKVFNKKNK